MGKIKDKLAEYYRLLKTYGFKPEYGAKVFCIGYNKTGTTSVGKSFEMLGLRNTSFNEIVWRKWYKKGKIERVLDYTARFDSTDDLPWLKADFIPTLDQRFPNSKFVYLYRDEEAWKKSMATWAEKAGKGIVDAEKEWEGYLAHQRFVESYFRDFPTNRFLKISVKDPKGLKKLGAFLGIEAPQDHFPVYNKMS